MLAGETGEEVDGDKEVGADESGGIAAAEFILEAAETGVVDGVAAPTG